MDSDLLRRAAAKLRKGIEGTSPGPWESNGYSAIFSGPKMRGYDKWAMPVIDQGHNLERREPCKACDGKRCEFYTEDYRREPLVAKVPSHHGDTAIEHAACDGAYIELMHPPVALALANLLTCLSMMPSASDPTDLAVAEQLAREILRKR